MSASVCKLINLGAWWWAWARACVLQKAVRVRLCMSLAVCVHAGVLRICAWAHASKEGRLGETEMGSARVTRMGPTSGSAGGSLISFKGLKNELLEVRAAQCKQRGGQMAERRGVEGGRHCKARGRLGSGPLLEDSKE